MQRTSTTNGGDRRADFQPRAISAAAKKDKPIAAAGRGDDAAGTCEVMRRRRGVSRAADAGCRPRRALYVRCPGSRTGCGGRSAGAGSEAMDAAPERLRMAMIMRSTRSERHEPGDRPLWGCRGAATFTSGFFPTARERDHDVRSSPAMGRVRRQGEIATATYSEENVARRRLMKRRVIRPRLDNDRPVVPLSWHRGDRRRRVRHW